MKLGWSQQIEKATAGFLSDVLASGREEAAGLDFMEEVLSLCSVRERNEPWVDLSGQSGSRLVRATGSIRLNMNCPRLLPQGSGHVAQLFSNAGPEGL